MTTSLRTAGTYLLEGSAADRRDFRFRPPRVFLIEDDDLFRTLLKAPLEHAGYEVDAAQDVPEAIEHLRRAADPDDEVAPPDVIVTDVYLTSSKTGLELAEELRAVGWTTPIVVMTSYSSPALAGRARAQWRCAFLEKPFEPSALEEVMRDLLADA